MKTDHIFKNIFRHRYTVNKRKSGCFFGLIALMLLGSTVIVGAAGSNNNHGPYTLEELIELAHTKNLALEIAGLDKQIAIEEYKESRTIANPDLEYAAGKAQLENRLEKPSLWSVGFSWSLPNPVHRYHLLQAGRAGLEGAGIQQEIVRNELIKNLKLHFYRLRFFSKIKTFYQEKLERLEQARGITKAKVSIGEAKPIDFLRSSVEIQKTRTQIFQLEKQIAYEKAGLCEFLNYAIPADFTIVDDFHFAPLPPIEEHLRGLIDDSPRVRLGDTERQKENANLKAARSSLIDSVHVFGEYEKEAEGKKWKVGAGVTLPLFNQNNAHIRKAKLLQQKSQLEYDHLRKHFFADIQRIMTDIRNLEKEIETYQGAILEEGHQNMELTGKLYQEGEVPLMVFLDSQNSYWEMQERYYEALTGWNILEAELQGLLGETLSR